MSAENVVSIGATRIESDRKALFLTQLSASYDNYADRHGVEPEAAMFVLGGVSRPQWLSWTVTGASEGMADAFMARALIIIHRELQKYD